jgi:hypothetical protein
VQSIAQRVDTGAVTQRKQRGARPRVDDRGLRSDVSHVGDVTVGRVLRRGNVTRIGGARITRVCAWLVCRVLPIEHLALVDERVDRHLGGRVGTSCVAAQGCVEARINRESIRVGDVADRACVAQRARREVDLGEAPRQP